MKSDYIKFLKQILIFSLPVGLIAAVIAFVAPARWISPTLPFLIFFFISITLLSYYFLQKAIDQRFLRFVNTYLLITLIKLIIYVAVMVIYLLLNLSDALPFIFSFLTLYLIYTVFEVVKIVGKTKKNTPSDPA